MLRIHFSNDTERLVELLHQRLAEAPGGAGAARSPFEPEHLVVTGAGMQRFLELAHARRFGIAANLHFAFPAQWIWQQVARVLPGASSESPFSAEVMSWRLLRWLDTDQPPGRLATWLVNADAPMRHELAGRIARLAEQLVTYRPDWLAQWARGRLVPLPGASAAQQDDQAWLARAWRHILAETGGPAEHPAHSMLAALAAAGPDAARRFGLPARVALFGLADLPPFYLDVFARLARHLEVDLYLFNPCREYWYEIISEQRRARLAAAGRAVSDSVHDSVHDSGNNLLAHWGGQTRAFLETLYELPDDGGATTIEAFQPISGDRLLDQVRRGILDLEEPAPGSLRADQSIAIHACHALTRQIEVLHDQLLARFTADPTLTPDQVLAVVPDLEAAAPAIEAVFGTVAEGDPRHIPWRITGRGARRQAGLARALFDLLDLAASRCTAGAVFDLLRQDAVARRFALAPVALERIHLWMRAAGMRWGRDAAHRAILGLPANPRHTLAHGLRQLFPGYAMPLPPGASFDDCLPYADVEGQAAEWLGALWQFLDRLAALADTLAVAHTPPQWAALLRGWLAGFFLPAAEAQPELALLQGAISDFERLAAQGGAEALALPATVMRRALEERVDRQTPGATPQGAVTFTGMAPLRQLPYRIVCVLGLEHGAFPAEGSQDEFDLIAAFPRKGDRQRRRDDRNVLLDLLTCARDALLLFYNGRHLRDNAPLPPAAPLAELIDWLTRGLAGPRPDAAATQAARAALVTEHPLQAHARRYFDAADPRLFSYRAAACNAAAAPARQPAAFFDAPLAPAGAEWFDLDLTDLTRFLRNPVAWLLEYRLGIGLRSTDERLADDEPFDLEAPGAWQVRDQVLELTSAGVPAEALRASALLHNELPDGVAGEIALEPVLAVTREFAARVAAAQAGAVPGRASFQLALGDFTLAGELDGLTPRGMLLARLRKDRPAELLDTWVRHLVLCCVRPAGVPACTQWLGEEDEYHLVEPGDARALLADLLELVRAGLHRPLPLFPTTAHAWALHCAQHGGTDPDYTGHHAKWLTTRADRPGESEHPAWRLVYGHAPLAALDAEFEALALRVFTPLLACRRKGLHEPAA